jgi:SAM-dependent methyltransferase
MTDDIVFRSERSAPDISSATDEATFRAASFYENVGWNVHESVTEDARRWEDLRQSAREYVSKCRLRLLRYIPSSGDKILDMASGPIQYEEYLKYSHGFRKRYCVDLSKRALELAREKIGDRGVYLHGNFLDMQFDNEFFDCCISLHTIYHIAADKQEEAVRKLLQYSRVGAPVIIVYGNPDRFRLAETIVWRATRLLVYPLVLLRRALRQRAAMHAEPADEDRNGLFLYYFVHPLDWWRKFEDSASVQIYPWRSLTADLQKKYIPNNVVGALTFSILFWLEDQAPSFFAKWGCYPLIVMRKRPSLIKKTRPVIAPAAPPPI